MSRREPSWWYGRPSLIQRLLMPAAAVYGAVAARRLAQPPRYRSHLPVICIGNFTAGGTGKTPATAWLAEALLREGHRPVVVSRGYGGRVSGPHAVDAARDRAFDVGDEPLMLARRVPVIVARDRVAGARAVEVDARRFTMVLLDDGLQNPHLHKDLVLAVVDGARGVGNGAVIPAGPLRAPLLAQFKRADAIILNGGGAQGPAALRAFSGPMFAARLEPEGDMAWVKGARVIAYAGIGAPQRFFDTLQSVGADVVDGVAFGDHHVFTPEEAAALIGRGRLARAQLVTTEKDLSRLGGDPALAALLEASRALPVRLAFATDDARGLMDLVKRRLAAAPSAT